MSATATADPIHLPSPLLDGGIHPDLAVDLGSPRSISRAKQRRGRKQAMPATLKQRVDTEANRLVHRIQWLERKASRLPIGNGKRKAKAEIERLQTFVGLLLQPPKRREKGKVFIGESKHAARAAALLNEIVPERAA